MAEYTSTTDGLREQLKSLLANWGAQMASVLDDLERQRSRVAELEEEALPRHARDHPRHERGKQQRPKAAPHRPSVVGVAIHLGEDVAKNV